MRAVIGWRTCKSVEQTAVREVRTTAMCSHSHMAQVSQGRVGGLSPEGNIRLEDMQYRREVKYGHSKAHASAWGMHKLCNISQILLSIIYALLLCHASCGGHLHRLMAAADRRGRLSLSHSHASLAGFM